MIEDLPEGELLRDPPGAARRNHGFWLVAGAMAIASVVVVVAIFANLGVKDTIAHAQHSLRTAQDAAEAVRSSSGTFRAAGASALAPALPELTLVGPDTPSRGLDEVSVAADGTTWAAAVQAQPGACFFVRLDSAGTVRYGSGTDCTGREAARSAVETDW